MKTLSSIYSKTPIGCIALYLIGDGCVTELVQAGGNLQTRFIQERTSHLAERQQMRNIGSIEEIRLWDTPNEKRLRAKIERGRALAAKLAQENPQMIEKNRRSTERLVAQNHIVKI
jgi:hypothetical protein